MGDLLLLNLNKEIFLVDYLANCGLTSGIINDSTPDLGDIMKDLPLLFI
jgi:hypothetical protein